MASIEKTAGTVLRIWDNRAPRLAADRAEEPGRMSIPCQLVRWTGIDFGGDAPTLCRTMSSAQVTGAFYGVGHGTRLILLHGFSTWKCSE